jgi:hypothetical protein
MGLTFQQLKEAMAPLSQIGKEELGVDVGGQFLVLRVLQPGEETAIQRYARAALTEGEAQDQMSVLEYLDRLHTLTLGYAIVQIGDVDLREVPYIETGEKLPNGVAKKEHKHEAVKKIVAEWARPMTQAVFKKFGELVAKSETTVEKLIEFDEVDVDAEIARLEEKLADLRELKSRKDLAVKDPRSMTKTQLLSSTPSKLATSTAGTSEAPIHQGSTQGVEPLVVAPGPEVPRELAEETPGESESLEPRLTSPKERKSVLGDVPTRKAWVAEATKTEPLDPLHGVESSFQDLTDPKVIEAENQKILERRSLPPQGQRPPHLSAREAYENLTPQGQEGKGSDPVQEGKRDGVDIYRLPVQSLSDRKGPPQGPVRPPAQGTVNPRFRPPTR